ncbi:MAG: hypothetical protein HQL74_15500 [Magnetococcales bacterium]|nr:hypothetical protein [Magnetococcales bacterium]
MNYSEMIQALQNATSFDLYRLQSGITALLDDPQRLQDIKRRLRVGMDVSFFNARENRLMDTVLHSISRTKVTLREKETGGLWTAPLYALNLDGANTDIHATSGGSSRHPLDKNRLKVGDWVGFHDRNNRELYGTIRQLNAKTASLVTTDGQKWRVSYALLFTVVEAHGRHEPEPLTIEGEIVSR